MRATLILAITIYAVALAGSVLLDVKANVLDVVPLCLAPAAFLSFYGAATFPRADRMARGVEAGLIVVALGLSLACLSYLGAIANLPLQDREMIWTDRHVGFDWLQMMQRLDHWPAVLGVFDLAYATFTAQLVATVFALVVARRNRDLDCFFITFVCASVLAEVASVVLPTLGPMSALAGGAHFDNLPTLGRTTADIVLSLRQGVLKSIDFDAINGIISFPSLHAAVAVIVPYSLRWNKRLFWSAAALDSVMFVSAVPSGNHYLTDVFGGLVVAVLAILCGPRIQALLAQPSIGRRQTMSALAPDTERSGKPLAAPVLVCEPLRSTTAARPDL